MKGRIVWVFWLVVVLAALTATASYAWLAMNTSSRISGVEVEAETDSVYLEISVDSNDGYDKTVSFDRVSYFNEKGERELSFITYGYLPSQGAMRIAPTLITKANADIISSGGVYNGSGRYYKAVKSDMTGGNHTYIDITSSLSIGQSLLDFYHIERGGYFTVSNTYDYNYYCENVKENGDVDYICIGKIPKGEKLSRRIYWGYARSDELDDAQVTNTLNIVSLDLPPEEYALHNTVYLRCAENTLDAKDLMIESVNVRGYKNYLTNAIRVMFVATRENGETVTLFYSHRNPEALNGVLFEEIYGDKKEVVKVDIYIFFDGRDPSSYKQDGFLTPNFVNVKFSISDHVYN
jgi:hypothetical protein